MQPRRVLFVENREKTGFWSAVADALAPAGHEIHFMVQNRLFAPANKFSRHFIPYPKGAAEEASGDDMGLLEADRGRNFFEAGSRHYAHYRAEIEALLERLHPDLVVGEATLFHELITCELCRKLGIPYVQPASNRYPQGRFSLLLFDEQRCAIGSGESLPEEVLIESAKRIMEGREIPFYMVKKTGLGRLKQRGYWLAMRLRVFAARLLGETYNTPSLRRKAKLQRQLKMGKARWAALAARPIPERKYILYPMQLQPEANVEVWGRPFSNQVKLVERLLRAAPNDVGIMVKANPKTKYEILTGILDLATSDSRVVLLPIDMSMAEAQTRTIGAITVTGTVGLEAIFGRGRCISLKHPVIEEEFPQFGADSPEEAVRVLLEEPERGRGSVELGAKLLARTVESSFPGVISDPVSHPHVMDPVNIRGVARALELCLK